MKGWMFVACSMLAIPLSGCLATLQSLSGNGPVAQARRTAYITDHPNDPYNASIKAGNLAVGMSLDDLQALYGSECGYSSESSVGNFYECHLNMLDNTDSIMVLVDNSGHVASWIE